MQKRFPSLPAVCCCLLLSSAAVPAQDATAKELRIGVYDVPKAGGQGASPRAIVRRLAKRGWRIETFTDLNLITLLQYDIVYLSDMHKPGPEPPDGRENVRAYVRAGGSVLQTWHHHILGDVGVGIRRIYGKRRMYGTPGFPALGGVREFQAAYADHIVEKVGPKGTVFIKDQDGLPVAVAGRIGKGKVISTGLSLNLPRVNPVELKLTEAFFRWLRPEVTPQERMSAVRTPQVVVSPAHARAAAGLPTVFQLKVGPILRDEPCRPEIDGAPVALAPVSPASVLRKAVFRLTAPSGRDSRTEHQVRVRIGEKTILKKFTLTGLFAPAPPGERRGVWLHVGMDRRPETVMPELKKIGINMAILRIAGGTAAFYASKVQPDVQDPLAEKGGDWLAEAVKYAHANGIELHAYVNNCIVEGRTSEESLRRLREQGRLQKDPAGRTINWFCPSQPENVEAMTRPMVEIAANYDVDGIQFDFIRYPGPRGCFCSKCRALFEKESGRPVAHWPDNVLEGGPRYNEYIEFRCERISRIVEHISRAVRRVNPKIKISAAVFRNWPECRVNNGQDWVRWCREGWLDFVCPMTYTMDAAEYERLVKIHRAALPDGFPVVEGIGIAGSSGVMDDPGKVALHIILARKAGAAGFCGFCYRPGATRALFAPLTRWLDQPARPEQ